MFYSYIEYLLVIASDFSGNERPFPLEEIPWLSKIAPLENNSQYKKGAPFESRIVPD